MLMYMAYTKSNLDVDLYLCVTFMTIALIAIALAIGEKGFISGIDHWQTFQPGGFAVRPVG